MAYMPDLNIMTPNIMEPTNPKMKFNMCPFAPKITQSMLNTPPMKLHAANCPVAMLTIRLVTTKPMMMNISHNEKLPSPRLMSVLSFIIVRCCPVLARSVHKRFGIGLIHTCGIADTYLNRCLAQVRNIE